MLQSKHPLHPFWAAALAVCATGCFIDRSPVDPTFDAGGGRDGGGRADGQVIEPDGGQERDAGRDGCSARAESCNGADDDCDGMIDEAVTEACDTACGEGVRTCADGTFGECDAPQPAVEECNDIDDDCNGMIDDLPPRACDNACGSGTETCSAGAWVGCTAPSPAAEMCNNVDDDCNGVIDDLPPRGCDNACGSGTETCSAGAWVACTAPAPGTETCNGIDDDCDEMIDDGVCTCEVRYIGTGTYLFCNTRASWEAARDACRAVGYDLVTIESTMENTDVWNTAAGISDSDWWIGLNDRTSEGRWQWSSGSTSSNRVWGTDQPSGSPGQQDCVALTDGSESYETRGRWNDTGCNDSLRYVCEVP